MIRAPDQAGLHQCLLTVDLEEECGEQESRLFIGDATVLMVTEGSSNYILIRLSARARADARLDVAHRERADVNTSLYDDVAQLCDVHR